MSEELVQRKFSWLPGIVGYWFDKNVHGIPYPKPTIKTSADHSSNPLGRYDFSGPVYRGTTGNIGGGGGGSGITTSDIRGLDISAYAKMREFILSGSDTGGPK